ncbi:MAG: hypothetical protein K1060chlam4_00662, partial [Candidatus Anoxychlamydiales bacterium]|nr:hypothetical protein [Candidatus Anoxychlamydiales bacterium]
KMPSKAIETKVIDASKDKVDKTAKKINYWAFFGLMFVTIGLIATTIATCGLNQIVFHATVATLDTILGSGAIGLTIGSLFITKALIDKNKKINKIININIPKRYGVIGIANKDTTTCWLNSLMQMLLNIPDLKETLKLNSHFKAFIDKYERALKEDIKIDTIALREFLKTICPDISSDSHVFHDSHEVLKAILDFFKNSNPNLRNTQIVKNHFLHPDGKKTTGEQREEDTGVLELPPPAKKQKIDNLQRWLSVKFSSTQNNEVNEIDIIRRYESKKYFFGLKTRQEEITEEVVVGKKTNVLEEMKLSFAPNDLFLSIQRYKFDSKTSQIKKINSTVKIPFSMQLSKNHFEKSLDTDYRLNNFICHIGNHYIAYVKKGNSWFICDDESVKKISLKKAIKASKNAYIVHYKKLG